MQVRSSGRRSDIEIGDDARGSSRTLGVAEEVWKEGRAVDRSCYNQLNLLWLPTTGEAMTGSDADAIEIDKLQGYG